MSPSPTNQRSDLDAREDIDALCNMCGGQADLWAVDPRAVEGLSHSKDDSEKPWCRYCYHEVSMDI